jgi:hypothetical protein
MDFELRIQNSIGESLMDIDKMSSLYFESPSPLPPSASKHTQSTRVQRTGKRLPERLRSDAQTEVRPEHSRLQKRCPLGPDFSPTSVLVWVKAFLPLAGCNTGRPRAAG